MKEEAFAANDQLQTWASLLAAEWHVLQMRSAIFNVRKIKLSTTQTKRNTDCRPSFSLSEWLSGYERFDLSSGTEQVTGAGQQQLRPAAFNSPPEATLKLHSFPGCQISTPWVGGQPSLPTQSISLGISHITSLKYNESQGCSFF